MAFTQNQLDAIERAIGSGTLTVTYDGNTTTYRSMKDLMDAHAFISRRLQTQGTTPGLPLSNRGPGSLTIFDRD